MCCRRFAAGVVALLLVPAAALPADMHDAASREFLTVTLENDLFAGSETDGGYTNGFAVSWAHGGFHEFGREILPDWIHALSKDLYISTEPGKHRAVSYSIGQGMQTPGDITVPTLIEDEAPYAGLLAWSVNLHAYDDDRADRLGLTLGVVGPISGAEQVQRLGHRITGSDEPQGWDHQIGNEPVFMVSAERLSRLADHAADGSPGVDLIGIGQAAAGTISSYLGAGLGFRYGTHLDLSFPTATVLPGRRVNPLAGSASRSWQVFVNVLGTYVANDITINGNTFRDSHSVPLEHWQAQASAGMVIGLDRWAFLLSAAVATDRYEGQPSTTRFGSLSVTYRH